MTSFKQFLAYQEMLAGPANTGPGMGKDQLVTATNPPGKSPLSPEKTTGLDAIITDGGLVGDIFLKLKNKQNALPLIIQAINLPDSKQRITKNSEIFNISDKINSPTQGVLSQRARDEIAIEVYKEIQKMMLSPQSISLNDLRGFANRVVGDYFDGLLKKANVPSP